MIRRRVFAISNKWFLAGTSLTLGFTLLAAIIGFVVLPYAQSDLRVLNVWDAICSAAGVPRSSSSAVLVEGQFKTSAVVTTMGLDDRSDVSIGRGATLALRCAICHGTSGTETTNVPMIAGQGAAFLYKQLEDFKSGARDNAVMGPFASALSERDIRDVAAFYSQLPYRSEPRDVAGGSAPAIVLQGAPMRNIVHCAACHDGSHGPLLTGQPAEYLKTQLEGFKKGIRHNDISQRMRNIARGMTMPEIDAAVQYFQDK